MKKRPSVPLTYEQRQELGSIAAANGRLGLKGINIAQVASRFCTTDKTARKWLLEGLQRTPNYRDAPRSGRPPKLEQLKKNGMRRHAVHHDTSRKIKERLESRHGIKVSLSTVVRVLGSGRNPLSWRIIMRGKALNHANIDKRERFCKLHAGDDFKKWVFLDQFDDYPCFDKDGSATRCWQAANSPPAPALGRPWSFRMYAAVGWNFKSPLFFVAPSPDESSKQHKSKDKFTAKGYISMMQLMKPYLDARFPDGDYVLIQDHAPQHRAGVSQQAMQQMGVPILIDYTAQSWDQSIIENVWGVLRDLLRGAKAKTTKGWYAAYRAAWSLIQQSTINKLVDGMPARLQSIIDVEGLWVSHH